MGFKAEVSNKIGTAKDNHYFYDCNYFAMLLLFRHLFCYFLIFSIIPTNGQSNQRLWEKLYSIKNKPVDISSHFIYFNGFYDSLIKEDNVIPVMAGSNVYAWINGTGRLYQLSDSGSLKFRRIDSTVHTGNNFTSLLFNYNNRLYNLGGYGFWKRNGQLRVYDNPSRGWQIVPLNIELPIIHSVVNQPLWYDQSEGKIYTCGYSVLDDAIAKKEAHNDVMVLDLKTQTWTKLGTLSDDYLEMIENGMKHSNNKFPITIVSLPWGLLVEIDPEHILLLDMKNNKILNMDESILNHPVMLINKYSNHFYVDSMYFAFDPFSNQLDSLKLTYKDFHEAGKTLYVSNDTTKNVLIGTLVLLVSLSAFLLYKKRKKSTKPIQPSSEPNHINTEQIYTNHQFLKLEQTEKNILEILILNSKQQKNTSIEELNRILGVSGKNINIQKKQRSDMILTLNRKLAMLMMNEEDVILKIRNPYDKRSFDYYIDTRFLDAITQLYLKLSS